MNVYPTSVPSAPALVTNWSDDSDSTTPSSFSLEGWEEWIAETAEADS